MSLESHYGKCLAKYEGKGTIIFDGKKYKCEFEVGQLLNGDIILFCHSNRVSFFRFYSIEIKNFEGITSDKHKIKSVGKISELNYLPKHPPNAKGVLAVRLEELSVQIKSKKVKSVSFGVANFRFTGIAPYKTVRSLPLELNDGKDNFHFDVIPVENYEKVINRVSTLKSIEPTCELLTDYKSSGGIRKLKKNVDALCRVISVARGTKIQWLYCNFYDEKEFCIRRHHFAHITKPYCPMPVIDYRVEGRYETKEFLEKAFEKYFELKDDFKLDKGTIDTFLDARSENDYLELRAAKLSIALEKLKNAYITSPISKVKEFTIDESSFQKIVPDIQKSIKNVLVTAGIKREFRESISSEGKIVSLNRKSFASIVRKLCKQIGLIVKETDITLFIQCRNKLVHIGDFYCNTATRKERGKCSPLASPREEYYFMVNFLDRIYLKLFAYDGIYINFLSYMTGNPERENINKKLKS